MEKNRDLLLVIDMQNVYLPGQEWACPSMPDVTRKVRALLDAKKQAIRCLRALSRRKTRLGHGRITM